MRYRPMGASGAIVSAVSLSLEPDPGRPRASDWVSFLYAALENGISTLVVSAADPVVLDGLAEALASVDRRLVFLALRLGGGPGVARDFSPHGLSAQITSVLARTGAHYLDAVLLEEPGADEVSAGALLALEQLKARGAINFLGVSGEGDPIDEHLTTGFFDLLAMPFNITSGWRERNRLRSAGASDVSVLGYRSYPRDFHAAVLAADHKPAARTRKNPLAGRGSYAFLDATPGWTPEEIGLSYALTEPSLASVLVTAGDADHLARLAAVTEREMPPGLAAQIEMARFTPGLEGLARQSA